MAQNMFLLPIFMLCFYRDMLLTENRVMMKCSTLNLYLVIDVVIVIDYVYVILV
jgi:hypothetical protein